MSESSFKIREKTIIVFGPITSLAQSIGTILLEHGADIAFLDENATASQRYINSLMDMRHVHSIYGRAATVNCTIQSAKDAKEAISRAAELFGSADVLVDLNLFGRAESNGHTQSELMTNEALEFLTGRGKGRVIYITVEDRLCHTENTKPLIKENERLVKFMNEKILELNNKAITLNNICVGYTEEVLLKLHPQKTIQSSFEEEKNNHANSYMTQPVDIANLVTFIASPISSCLNGQRLHANYALTIDK